jgi:hypothetical protein
VTIGDGNMGGGSSSVDKDNGNYNNGGCTDKNINNRLKAVAATVSKMTMVTVRTMTTTMMAMAVAVMVGGGGGGPCRSRKSGERGEDSCAHGNNLYGQWMKYICII